MYTIKVTSEFEFNGCDFSTGQEIYLDYNDIMNMCDLSEAQMEQLEDENGAIDTGLFNAQLFDIEIID